MSNTWKPANYVYEVRPRAAVIKGRKARNRRPLSQVPVYMPADAPPVDEAKDLKKDVEAKDEPISAVTVVIGKVGFVTGLDNGDVLWAIPKNPNAEPRDLDTLLRTGSYHILRIKWLTFENQFDVA